MSKKLRINEIELDGGTQARAGLNDATVTEYRALVEESQQASAETGEITWPFRDPIEIYYDGDRYWLADGFHRVAACRQAGRYVVQANIRQGTRRDAILFAAGANADHGLRRTDTDKRRAVQRLLDDPEWSLWSDREIARACKVSHPFVARLRSFMPPAVTGNVTSERERTYTTKHGTTAVMNTANIGRQPEYKQVLPELVYGWLKNYRDDKGRIWRDLEDTQVHHRNSPCFQAYIEQFPNLTDPKFYLKQALARLKREDKAETAVSLPLENEKPLERITTWRLMAYVDEWLNSDSFQMSGWAGDDLGALGAIISKRVGWRVLFDSIKNHIGLANYTEDDLHEAIKNVFNRIELVRPNVRNGEQTAVSPGSAAPIATYWLRNYVDPVHNRRWVDIEDSQIYGKKSDVCMAFKKQHPDIGDHGELLKNALAVLKRERAAEFTESIKALWDATLRLVAQVSNQELIFKLNLAAQDLDMAYQIAKETAVSEEVES